MISSPDCQHTEKISCFLCRDTSEVWVQLVICGRTTSIYSSCVMCAPVPLPVEKYMMLLLKKDAGSSFLGLPVSRYYLCFLLHQCSSHCLPRERNTKHSMRQCTRSKDGRGSQYQLCSECHYLWSAYWEAPRASTRACCVFCHAVSCLSTHFQGQRWKCAIGAQR